MTAPFIGHYQKNNIYERQHDMWGTYRLGSSFDATLHSPIRTFVNIKKTISVNNCPYKQKFFRSVYIIIDQT